ncbi:hypothetical protein LWE61_00840 [Sphingobium sufflavum]|uniref:hypothetical protein n=1 Tax=Sphingobium sufflavum TaxID=1129547 RepID=UPI001F48B637|nr:hypothetical protein [Sphingobium sufflavum]MCE7795096.1 hypothetical protein [Sphingobium sufflavum]
MTLTESPQREARHAIRADVRLSGMAGEAHGGEMLAEGVMIDLSRHGMGTDGLIHFPPESAVHVTFPDGTTRTGTAMWHDSFWSGIRFDAPLTSGELARLIATLERKPHFIRHTA